MGRPSPQECEFYVPVAVGIPGDESHLEVPSPQGRSFYTGSELGVLDTLQISSGSYSHLVGLMGPYNAGKTCFLLSLYLMASQRLLPDGFLFSRSLTLQGFEDRARRIRQWRTGPLPDQLADHTVLGDDRRPGFLHLGIEREQQRLNILFSDLPGEWTTSLINRSETAKRWEFLKRADGIIVVLDGADLVGKDRFNYVISTKQLFHRLIDDLQVALDIPLVLLVSKADELNMQQPVLVDEITQYATDLGLAPKVVLCASFSRNPQIVPNGTGVVDALEHIIKGASSTYIDWNQACPPRWDVPARPFRLFQSATGVALL